MRPARLLLMLFLAGCATPMEEPVFEPEPMMEEPRLEICGDDGIGGTGCPADAS